MIVAVGGITLKSNRGQIRFLWYALKSLRQAKRSEGCLHAAIFRHADVYVALSVWETEKAMRAFGASDGHTMAVRKTRHIVKSAINHSYTTNSLPTRDAAISEWLKATA